MTLFASTAMFLLAATVSAPTPLLDKDDDRETVARLDIEFQAAVKRNDVATIDRILHPDYCLVAGDGRRETREMQLADARSGRNVFEQQDEFPGTQTVRVVGDTAVVTAKLWVKGTRDGVPFDHRVWFSDTYVRTPQGWKYYFGQASLPLPAGSR